MPFTISPLTFQTPLSTSMSTNTTCNTSSPVSTPLSPPSPSTLISTATTYHQYMDASSRYWDFSLLDENNSFLLTNNNDYFSLLESQNELTSSLSPPCIGTEIDFNHSNYYYNNYYYNHNPHFLECDGMDTNVFEQISLLQMLPQYEIVDNDAGLYNNEIEVSKLGTANI